MTDQVDLTLDRATPTDNQEAEEEVIHEFSDEERTVAIHRQLEQLSAEERLCYAIARYQMELFKWENDKTSTIKPSIRDVSKLLQKQSFIDRT